MKLKAKPRTIADLKINWTFEQNFCSPEVIEKFEKLNPSLNSVRIKEGSYKFIFNGPLFIVNSYKGAFEDNTSLSSFFDDINYFVAHYGNFELDRIELLADKSFKIHVKEQTTNNRRSKNQLDV